MATFSYTITKDGVTSRSNCGTFTKDGISYTASETAKEYKLKATGSGSTMQMVFHKKDFAGFDAWKEQLIAQGYTYEAPEI